MTNFENALGGPKPKKRKNNNNGSFGGYTEAGPQKQKKMTGAAKNCSKAWDVQKNKRK